MADSIFTSQTPIEPNRTTPAATFWAYGMRFAASQLGWQFTRGRIWVPSNGWPDDFWWQLFRITTPATLLAEVDTHTLPTPTLGAWMDIPAGLFAPVPGFTGVTYGVRAWSTGNPASYARSNGQTVPVGSGGVISADRAYFDTALTNRSQPPSSLASSDHHFYVDIFAERVPPASIAIVSGIAFASKTALSSGISAAIASGTATASKSALSGGTATAVAGGTATASKNASAFGVCTGIALTRCGPSRTVRRPFTGTVSRPDTGTITRPDTGTIIRP